MRRWYLSIGIIAFAAFWAGAASMRADVQRAQAQASSAQVLLGRQLVLTHACGDCHGGFENPAGDGWLTGVTSPEMEIKIGRAHV